MPIYCRTRADQSRQKLVGEDAVSHVLDQVVEYHFLFRQAEGFLFPALFQKFPAGLHPAMQMTAVYSCVRILAEAVAGLPLHLYRYKEDGGKEKAIDHPLYLLLHDEPNPEMSSFVFRETLMTHLLLWGNAYAQIIRNGKGEVIALYPLMPDRMTVDRDRDGKLYYEYTVSTDDAPTVKGTVVRLKPSDVLHVPGLGFDGLVGYSPIAMAKNAIGMAIACEEYGAKFFCQRCCSRRRAGASGNY